MMPDDLLFPALVAAVVLVFGVLYGVARYEECRKVHPAWYCLAGE